MSGMILWATVGAWLLLVGVAVSELIRHWRQTRQAVESR